MKLIWKLLSIAICATIVEITVGESEGYHRFKSVACTGSNQSLFYNCSVKAFNRRVANLNVEMNIFKPLTELMVSLFKLQLRIQ